MMKTMLKLTRPTLITAALLSSGIGFAQSSEPVPYGKKWAQKNYSKTQSWISSSIIVAYRPGPGTEVSDAQATTVFGVEVRGHLNNKVSIMVGAHFSGYTLENDQSSISDTTDYNYTGLPNKTEIVYRNHQWQLGMDFGLLESKYFHIQAGPRIGLQQTSVDLEGEDEILNDSDEFGVSTGLLGGGVLRLGVFATPYVETGLHLQADYALSSQAGGTGIEIGWYSTVHF
jgi:hypothetical protein